MVKSITDILNSNNFDSKKLSEIQINHLEDKGYLLLEPKKHFWDWIGCNPKELRKVIDNIKLKEGDKAGSEGKEENTVLRNKTIEPGANRVGNLLDKSEYMKKIATLPEILWSSYLTIKGEIKLSSVLFREPKKDSGDQQLHIDWKPRKNIKENFKVVVAFLYLEDSTKKNGATKLVPGSHKILSYPDKYVDQKLPHKNEITVEAKAGSVLIINGLLWHKGGNNFSGEKRGIVVVEYRSRELKQLLNLKKYIKRETQENLNENEKYLFGLRDDDVTQDEKSYGPGDDYRTWLKKNKNILR